MKASTTWETGIFGMILIGMSSLLLGLMSRILALDPIVYFAAMAGVLVPAVMVASGALARWASVERAAPAASLAAGLVTLLGGASLCFLTLAISQGGKFLSDGLKTHFTSLNAYGYLEIMVLLAAYLALSAIGGILYGLIFPAARANI